MPNFNPDIMTPGSAVADSLQMILARRKEEARQMMMDRLGVEKFRSDEADRTAQRANQEAQLGLERQRTDASVAADNERRITSKIDSLGFGEQDLENIQDEELRRELTNRGRTRMAPGPSVTTTTDIADVEFGPSDHAISSETTVGPGKAMYTGSQKFQEEQVARQRLMDYINNNPAIFNDNPELKNALMIQHAGASASVPASVMSPRPSVTPILPTGRPGAQINLPRGGEAMELGWAPQQPRPQFVGVDTNSGRPINMNPDGSYTFGNIPEGATLGPKPSAAAGASDILTTDMRQRLAQARGTPNPDDDQQAIATILGNARVSQGVKDTVQDIYAYALEKGDKRPSADQLMASVDPNSTNPPLTPQEMAEISSLLITILGGN